MRGDMSDNKDWVCVAAIAGAFGVSGEIKLKSFTQIPESCVLYGPLYNEAGELLLTPQSHRVMNNHIALKTEDVQSREAAQALKGMRVYVPRAALPAPGDEDDFYYSDLVGLDVKTTDGKRMGTVLGVHEFGAGDMLEIKPPLKSDKGAKSEKGASFFHPFTKKAVPKVDLKAGRIIIEIVEPEIGRAPNSGPDGLAGGQEEE